MNLDIFWKYNNKICSIEIYKPTAIPMVCISVYTATARKFRVHFLELANCSVHPYTKIELSALTVHREMMNLKTDLSSFLGKRSFANCLI